MNPHNVVCLDTYKIKKSIESCSYDHSLYYNLSLKLSENCVVEVDIDGAKNAFTKQALLIKSIELEPSNAFALNNLANSISMHEVVNVKMGGMTLQLSATSLYERAISADPNYANAYCSLGARMQEIGLSEITLCIQGAEAVFTTKSLFSKAIECDKTHAIAYNNLGLCLNKEEYYELSDGVRLNAEALFLKSIECDNTNADAYYNLSTILKSDQHKVITQIGENTLRFDKQSLLAAAIKHNPNHASAYYNLALLLYSLQLPNIEIEIDGHKQTFSESDLYIKSIESDHHNPFAYFNLASITEPNQTVEIKIDGKNKVFSKRDLYIKTIEHQPDYAAAYANLSNQLNQKESVRIKINGNINIMTKDQLQHAAILLSDG